MFKNNLETLLLISTLSLVASDFCPVPPHGVTPLKCRATSEMDEGIEVHWPATSSGKIVFSRPLCLDSNKNPIVHTCCNGMWGQLGGEKCALYAYKFAFKCPPNYSEIPIGNSTLCVLVSKPSAWTPACISSGTETSWVSISNSTRAGLLSYLARRSIPEVWLPAHRSEPLRPLTWALAGDAWKQPVFGLDIAKSDNNCLKLLSSGALETENCEKQLPSLCLYDHEPVLGGLCKGWVTRYSPQSSCFSIEKATDTRTLDILNVSSVEGLHIFQSLSASYGLQDRDLCLVKGPQSHNPGGFYVVDSHGKLKVSPTFNCVVRERPTHFPPPELVLRFDENKRKLLLIAYSVESFWKSPLRPDRVHHEQTHVGVKCFTNAEEVQKEVRLRGSLWSGSFSVSSQENVTKHIFDVKMSGDSPGMYWCEGFSLPNMTLVESNRVVAAKKPSQTFSSLIDFPHDPTFDFDQPRTFKGIAKGLREELKRAAQTPEARQITRSLSTNLLRVFNESSDFLRGLFHISVFEGLAGTADDLPAPISSYYATKGVLLDLLTSLQSSQFALVSLNSTDLCLPAANWSYASIGQRSLSRHFCLQSSGFPVSCKCVGDFLYGGTWEHVDVDDIMCENEVPEITKTLSTITLSPSVSHETINAMSEMTTNSSQIIPSDVYFLGKTVQDIANLQAPADRPFYENLAAILNNLMEANETIVRQSQEQLNATNMLLLGFDEMMSQMNFKVTQGDDGTMLLVTPKLVVFVSDPSVASISGIALVSASPKNDFHSYEIRSILASETVENLLTLKDIELGTFVPQELLDRIDEVELTDNATFPAPEAPPSPLRVVISIYFNDLLFDSQTQEVISKVMSVQIPGRARDLPVFLPTVFKSSRPAKEDGVCGYWTYETWANDGCEVLGTHGDLVACGCSHLTHFAYLIMGTFYHQDSGHKVTDISMHSDALDTITVIGCSLSLIGIFGIAVTAVVFKSWREKPGTKVLLQLSAAVALEMVLIAFVNTETLSKDLILTEKITNCVILGASLHYSILVAFTWMLITALLQFMRYVKVLGDTRPPHFLLKASIIGWGAPLIPVLTIALIYPESYIPPVDVVIPGICYPKGNALYFGLILPIAAIVIANLVIFVMVIYSIFKIPELAVQKNERDLLVSQLRLCINLFFLLGLSWIFGLATISKAGIIFSYLFCLTATLQGFVLFVYFIVMDPVTRKFWQLFLASIGLNCFQQNLERVD